MTMSSKDEGYDDIKSVSYKSLEEIIFALTHRTNHDGNVVPRVPRRDIYISRGYSVAQLVDDLTKIQAAGVPIRRIERPPFVVERN